MTTELVTARQIAEGYTVDQVRWAARIVRTEEADLRAELAKR